MRRIQLWKLFHNTTTDESLKIILGIESSQKHFSHINA